MKNKGEVILYQAADGKSQLKVYLENETYDYCRNYSELFDKDSDTIGLHIKNIFEDEELQEKSTTEVF